MTLDAEAEARLEVVERRLHELVVLLRVVALVAGGNLVGRLLDTFAS